MGSGQAYKDDLSGFEAWYEPWQAAMKSDSTMKWMRDARTEVTKRRGLAANSRARARITSSYLPPGVVAEHNVDPTMPNEVIAAAIATRITAADRRRALIEVTREWEFEPPGFDGGSRLLGFHHLEGTASGLASTAVVIPPRSRSSLLTAPVGRFSGPEAHRASTAAGGTPPTGHKGDS